MMSSNLSSSTTMCARVCTCCQDSTRDGCICEVDGQCRHDHTRTQCQRHSACRCARAVCAALLRHKRKLTDLQQSRFRELLVLHEAMREKLLTTWCAWEIETSGTAAAS